MLKNTIFETSNTLVQKESDALRSLIEKRERESAVKTKQMIMQQITKWNEENLTVKGLVGRDEPHKTAGRLLESLSEHFTRILENQQTTSEQNKK